MSSLSLDARLRDIQALLDSVVGQARARENETPSHWELPVLPPPNADGQLSSTDLLNWWFRGPWPERGPQRRMELDEPQEPHVRTRARDSEPLLSDGWSEISLVMPEPEEHLAEEHAQAAVDCLYDFLHAVGQRDVLAAGALLHDGYHTIENGQEIDKPKFLNHLAAQLDGLRDWDFEVSIAVAPEPVNHPQGVLIHAKVQFDAVHRADGTKDGHVEERVAVLREDDGGVWKIVALPRIAR